MAHAGEVLTSATIRSPKTVLGFFAIGLGILATASAAVVGLLARAEPLHYLIPWVLGFGASAFVVVLAGVFVTAWKDPTILMLGQVTGEVFIQNRRLSLGDSTSGEHSEQVIEAHPVEGAAVTGAAASDDSGGNP